MKTKIRHHFTTARTQQKLRHNFAIGMLVLLIGGCATPSQTVAPSVILKNAHEKGSVVAFNSAATILASAGADGTLRLWRLPEGKHIKQWPAHDGTVYGIEFIDNDRRIITAGFDGALIKWDLEGRLKQRKQTPVPIQHMVADARADVIITGHTDGAVRIWKLNALTLESEYRLHKKWMRAVAWHGPTRQIASSGRDGRVYVWRRNQSPRLLETPPFDAYDIVFSPNGRWLMGSGLAGLYKWSLADGRLQVLATKHRGIIKAIDYINDGSSLASISRQTDSAVFLLDAMTGVVNKRFKSLDLCGEDLRVSRNGRYMATTDDDDSVRIWDFSNPGNTTTNYIRIAD